MAIPSTTDFRKAADRANARPPFSVRKLAGKQGLSDPISVRDLMGHLAPKSLVFESEYLKAGDVAGNAWLALFSNGAFSLMLKFEDEGHYMGDGFKLEATIGNYSFFWEQHLDAGAHIDMEHKDGMSASIERDFLLLASQTVTWHLHSHWEIDSVGSIIGWTLGGTALAAVAIVGIAWAASSHGSANATYSPNTY
ncbi:MAG TPA: hypothetical protein VGQ38_10090 [Gaiellaceae bacterium]|jgi:hypothetical protein|nr:hypothetical protein [Gaiellaceae bacterium]